MITRFAVFYTIYVLAIAGIVFCAVLLHKPKPVTQKPTNKLGSIVRLVDHDSGQTFCSGSVISDNLIVTAGHCLIQAGPFGLVSLKTEGIDIRTDENYNLNVSAKAVWITPQLDQGLLRGNFHRFEHRGIITDIHDILDTTKSRVPYVTCGYPMGGHLTCTYFQYERLDNFAWRGEGLLIPGMSGGPTMTKDGAIVGVNIAVDGPDALVSPVYNLDQEYSQGENK
jgi:Trypsin